MSQLPEARIGEVYGTSCLKYPCNEFSVSLPEYEAKKVQIRLEPDGSVAVFINRTQRPSTSKMAEMTYEEFYAKIEAAFFPEKS